MHRVHLLRCGSTNEEAMRLGRQGAPHGTVITAEEQDRGRGRRQRSWHSPAGENLYCSVLLRPAILPKEAQRLTLCAGIATAEAIAEEVGTAGTVELKWPNDVLLCKPGERMRKVAGILTEMVATSSKVEFVVVGIGVNLNTLEFPAELVQRAVSLRQVLGREVPPRGFVEHLLAGLYRWVESLTTQGMRPIREEFLHYAGFVQRGDAIHVEGVDKLRWPVDLDEEGALVVKDQGGKLDRVLAGDVYPVSLL